MIADFDPWSSVLVALLCMLALGQTLVALARLSAINMHVTCARICIGAYAKFAGSAFLLVGGLDWFISPIQALFRWLFLVGGCLILAGDGLLSVRWLRGKYRRDLRAKLR